MAVSEQSFAEHVASSGATHLRVVETPPPVEKDELSQADALRVVSEIGRGLDGKNVWSSAYPRMLSFTGDRADWCKRTVEGYDHFKTVTLARVLGERGRVTVTRHMLRVVNREHQDFTLPN